MYSLTGMGFANIKKIKGDEKIAKELQNGD